MGAEMGVLESDEEEGLAVEMSVLGGGEEPEEVKEDSEDEAALLVKEEEEKKEGDEKEEGEEDEFPWFPLMITYLIMASDAITMTIIQPLAPDQVRLFFSSLLFSSLLSFSNPLNRQCREIFGMASSAGTCTGALVGAFTLGCCFSGLALGHLAGKGRERGKEEGIKRVKGRRKGRKCG